jgi:hypothetical protein
MSTSRMRFTVVDDDSTISFVGPPHYLKALTAGCSRRPADHRSLLALAAEYDADLIATILNGLTVFDEHNTPGHAETFHQRLREDPSPAPPPFRVVDDETRRLSLQPEGTGLVVYNLPARRIVQIQNSYAELRRQDRGRIRRDGRPTRDLYHYRLPNDWTILP